MLVDKITPEMEENTRQKFAAWDLAKSQNLVENNIDAVSSLLQDPTIFLYAFFKYAGKPLKLYPYQDMILNDDSKRIIFAASNQIGKSIALCCKAIHYALTNPGKTILMVSKTLPQAKDLVRQIKQLLDSSIIDYQSYIGESMNKTEIYFKHFGDEDQSRIICVPATEAALGYAVDLMLIDELAFYDDGRYFYFQIAQPRTYTTKGQIICFSNPNGQQGIFWELWQDDDFSKYNFNFLDKPGNTEKELEKLRKTLTREEFDSTVMAVFTNPAGGFLTYEERKSLQEERPNSLPGISADPFYIFFDFAKTQDRTVRVIGKAIHKGGDWANAVHVHEMLEYSQGTPYSDIVDELHELIKTYGAHNIAMIGWDNTGVGKGVEDFINKVQQLGIPVMPVEFSLRNKSRMYTLFKLLVEQKRITIPFVDECDKQLAQLRFKRTEGNVLKVHHENERDRDDFPDALAGVCSMIVQPDFVPVSFGTV